MDVYRQNGPRSTGLRVSRPVTDPRMGPPMGGAVVSPRRQYAGGSSGVTSSGQESDAPSQAKRRCCSVTRRYPPLPGPAAGNGRGGPAPMSDSRDRNGDGVRAAAGVVRDRRRGVLSSTDSGSAASSNNRHDYSSGCGVGVGNGGGGGGGGSGGGGGGCGPAATMHYTQFLLKLGYRMGHTIGTGSYSKVKVADLIDLRSGQFMEKVACKMIDTRKASKSYATKFLPRELAILRSIIHPNLVRVKQIVDLGPLVCVFMEYGSLGDLLDYVQKQGAIQNTEARQIFRQIMQALVYLHGRGIAHRDLKCENVLRFPDGVVKLTDFGFARGFLDPSTGNPVLSRTYCGSMAYAAPEILQAQPYNPTKYDMWSVGCILYIMVTGKMPFSDRSTGQQLEQQVGRSICFPRGSSLTISFACKKLIRDLLNPQPLERPSAEEVLNSTWIKYGNRVLMRPATSS